MSSIKLSGGSDIQQLVAVNAVAAKLSALEVTRLGHLSSVARIVPDLPITHADESSATPAANVASSQVVPPANPAPCPATTTSPTGVPGVVQEPEADQVLHASDGNPSDPDMANNVLAPNGQPANGKGVVVANNSINNQAGNPNFIRPDGTEVAVNVPPQDTTMNAGSDEFDEDESSVAAQGTVVYQYDTGIGTGQTGATNQGALPFSGLPPTCKFYILGDAPGASMVDDSNITTPPSLGTDLESQDSQDQLESQYIAFVDHVTDAAQPAFQADEISLSLIGGSVAPQTALTANDAAVAAGVSVFVSAGDAGESQQSGSSQNAMAADPAVMDLGGTDGNRLIALNDGFQSYASNQMGAISSAGVATTFRVVDVVAPSWFGGEAACGNGGGCNSFYPTESARGTSESAPLTAGGGADVIEAYRNTHNGASPTPAMQKSIIDGTALDLDNPAQEQGSGMLDVYRAVEAAMQMPGTTDTNPPPADSRGLIPTPSQLDVKGAAGTSTSTSVSLYNTDTSPTTVTGTWRDMGPQFNLQPNVSENVSAPAYGSSVPPVGATAAAPVTFTVPSGLARLEMTEVTPDATNNTMVQIYLFDPEGRFVQDSYDDGTTSQGITTLNSATAVGATNLGVPSTSSAVVGNKVSIDSGSNQEIDTVAAVGKPSSSTTLTAAAAAGATNIKVAADTNITAGDTVTIDTGTSQETATVAAVGTPTTNTTLRGTVSAGATTITTPSAPNIAVGDTITSDTGTNAETAVAKTVVTTTGGGAALVLTTAVSTLVPVRRYLRDLWLVPVSSPANDIRRAFWQQYLGEEYYCWRDRVDLSWC